MQHGLLQRLQQHGTVSAEQAQALARSHTPWWLQILLAFAAWFASLLIMSSLLGPVLALTDEALVRLIAGGVLLGLAVFLHRQQQVFLQHMALAFALAAQGIWVFSAADYFPNGYDTARYSCLLLSTVLWFVPLGVLHQRICLCLALGCALSFTQNAQLLALVSVAVQAFCVSLWLSRAAWAPKRFAPALRSLLPVLTLGALLLSFVLQSTSKVTEFSWLQGDISQARYLASSGLLLILLATVYWLSAKATWPSRAVMLLFMLLLGALMFHAPALLAATALLLACFYASAVRWVMLLLALQCLALSQFYYNLQLDLLQKSMLMALAAVLLFCGWALLTRYQRRVP